ncbi:MAG: hypothetical protein K2W88_06605 [Pararheinheimera sp.]|nr:hypothetical protein [Rheinheimera sp.]
MIENLKAQLSQDELESLDIFNEAHWDLWAYNDDCFFELEYDVNPLQFSCHVQQMLRYVIDSRCVKKEIIFEALFELAREVYRDRYEPDIGILSDSIKNIDAEGRLGEWLRYVNFLHSFYLKRGSMTESDALQLCLAVLIPLPEYDWRDNGKDYEIHFTGHVIDGRHEIKYFRNLPPGCLILPQFLYVDMSNLDWTYRFGQPLDPETI